MYIFWSEQGYILLFWSSELTPAAFAATCLYYRERQAKVHGADYFSNAPRHSWHPHNYYSLDSFIYLETVLLVNRRLSYLLLLLARPHAPLFSEQRSSIVWDICSRNCWSTVTLYCKMNRWQLKTKETTASMFTGYLSHCSAGKISINTKDKVYFWSQEPVKSFFVFNLVGPILSTSLSFLNKQYFMFIFI